MKRVTIIFACLASCLGGIVIPVGADEPPFVVVSKSPDFQTKFIGSPSIAILPSGNLVASHTWFGPGTSKDTTQIFSSVNRGETWNPVCEVKGQFWSTLFVHNDELYLFGTDGEFGSIVIRRSKDEGKTWSNPNRPSQGLLLKGKYATAPVPVVIHANRIWRSIEQPDGNRTLARVVSADVDADLLDASSWTISAPVAMDPTHFGRKSDKLIDGNLVAHPESGLINMLSVIAPRADLAALLPVSPDGERLSYQPSIAFVNFPGGRSKFTVRYDPNSGKFWSISNRQHQPFAGRNVLVLTSSRNLRDWEVETVLLHHVDSIWHGFHNADWQFDGADLVAVCQTSWDGAKNATRSNYLTFHRFPNFRSPDQKSARPMFGRVRKCEFDHVSFRVSGTQFSVEDFQEDAQAFARYSFKFKNIPKELEGWKFTKTVPGSTVQMQVAVKQDTELFMMTAATGGGVIDVTGWEPVEASPFFYSNRAKTGMTIFSRSAKRGETIDVPQGNWAGGMLLIPPEGGEDGG